MTRELNTIVTSVWFQRVILTVIAFAGVLAGLETNRDLVDRYSLAFAMLDRLILAVFVVELSMKIAACGARPWKFFQDPWNIFDFVIVALCFLPAAGPFTAVLRVARVLRVLRVVSVVPRLQLLVGALLKSLGSMGYVGLLLGILFYIYGVAGVHLFGRNDPVHFGSLPTALLALFQVVTLEDWGTLFKTQRYGSANFGYEGQEHLIVESSPMPVIATVYFISFILLGTMIILNLFIGIVMNSMAEMHEEMAEREQRKEILEGRKSSLAAELDDLERQVTSLSKQAARLRRLVAAEDRQFERDSPVEVLR